MNNDATIKKAMSLLGKRKSAAKALASRNNGAKGGRPKKVVDKPNG